MHWIWKIDNEQIIDLVNKLDKGVNTLVNIYQFANLTENFNNVVEQCDNEKNITFKVWRRMYSSLGISQITWNRRELSERYKDKPIAK